MTRTHTLMAEAQQRGELVQSRETGLWMMGPYTGPMAEHVFRAAGGHLRQTEAERAAQAAENAALVAEMQQAVTLARQAEALGIRITRAQFRALIRRRPDAIAALQQRIAAAN